MDTKLPFRLAEWIVEPAFNQVSKGHVTHRIEPKVMRVLLVLAAQSRQVVSKESILSSVWPNTHVGEDALTRCISALRHVLGDDPHKPHFIRTVSKAGYCLLVDASPCLAASAGSTPLEAGIGDSGGGRFGAGPSNSSGLSGLSAAANPTGALPGRSGTGAGQKWAVLTGLAIVALLAIWAFHSREQIPSQPSLQTFQLTTEAGEQSSPALSPDGKRLAFVLASEDGSTQHICIKNVGDESVKRLSNVDGREFSPVWAPDGSRIAYLSDSPDGLGLYVAKIPATSESPRRIYMPSKRIRWEQGALSWSPDGKGIVVADQTGAQSGSSINRVDLATLSAQSVTTPPSAWTGDFNPVFSPDGQKLAFLRASEGEVTDLYWMPASGGAPRQITRDRKLINGLTWTADSRELVFSSDRAGQFALWKIGLDGDEAQRLPVGADNSSQPAISTSGNRLAYVQGSSVFAIVRVTSGANSAHQDNEQIVLSSTADDSAPSASPDGRQIAFQSWRSGTQQLWLASSGGQSLHQLTPGGGPLSTAGTPTWSPDGSQIAFDARSNGHSHIFAIAPAGGTPKQITFGEDNDIIPRWSNDGRVLYFRSNRGGRWQLWKQTLAGGAPQPITESDGIGARESTDGKWLYFAKADESGLWRMPIAGGATVKVLTQPAAGYWGYWTISRNSIYFLNQEKNVPTISFYDPLSGKSSVFAELDRLPPIYYSGMSAVGGGQEILICSKRSVSRHISIAQGTF